MSEPTVEEILAKIDADDAKLATPRLIFRCLCFACLVIIAITPRADAWDAAFFVFKVWFACEVIDFGLRCLKFKMKTWLLSDTRKDGQP